MKKIYPLKRIVPLSTVLLLTIILFVVYSCRKDMKIMPLSAADSVDAARSWYEVNYPVSTGLNSNNLTTQSVKTNNGAQFDYSQYIKPDWNHGVRYKRFSKDVIEMPVDPTRLLKFSFKNSNTGKVILSPENSRAWFLLLMTGRITRRILWC